MKRVIKKKHIALALCATLFLCLGAYFVLPNFFGFKYVAESDYSQSVSSEPWVPKETALASVDNIVLPPTEENVVVTHITTPLPVKAVYLSAWSAGSKSVRNKVMDLINNTELNAVVIDVKDYTGRISFPVSDPDLISVGSAQKKIVGIKSFIKELHDNNIYVIGRIATFQDPYLAKKWSEFAVKRKTDQNALWLDDKCKRAVLRGKESDCTYWLDAGAQKVWDYVVAIGQEAYADGFDELNYDYIRYPADGDLKDIYYPISNGKKREIVVKSFFEYLHTKFANTGPKISADLFGLTTTEPGDLGIGQVLEDALLNFDYVAPMVYPSHFAPDTYGYKNPATKPYEIISFAMKKAVERAKALNIDPLKLRPWLQDFNLGAVYTPEMVKLEMKAVYDSGLTSWMLWDPANTYAKDNFLPN